MDLPPAGTAPTAGAHTDRGQAQRGGAENDQVQVMRQRSPANTMAVSATTAKPRRYTRPATGC
jgi:hypothetical protein